MRKLFSAVAVALSLLSPVMSHANPVLRLDNIYETASYPEAHASTIVETRNGTIAAAWFGGTHERHPDVAIWFARLENGKWQTPVAIADGVQFDGTRNPTWNPVLFQAPDGELHLFYKVGPSPQTWWGMVIHSKDDGRTWGKPERLPEGILGPIKNKPVTLSDGSWLSPSSTEDREGMTGVGNAAWRLHFERSADKGKTWTKTADVSSPIGIEAIQPSILFHKNGQLQAMARTRQGTVAMTWSKDNGLTWSPLAATNLPNPNSGTDAITLADGRQLIVYNPSGHFPDQPGKGPRYPISVALSDDGVTWRNVLTLEGGPLKSGYAYPAVIQASDGRIHISYTWDRKRIRHVVIDPAKLDK
jgi:predicted neuraminidase